MSLQMQVTVAGMEKKSANPNAPYSLNTSEGVRFKVFDRDGIVVRLMQLVGQPIVVNGRARSSGRAGSSCSSSSASVGMAGVSAPARTLRGRRRLGEVDAGGRLLLPARGAEAPAFDEPEVAGGLLAVVAAGACPGGDGGADPVERAARHSVLP